MLKTLNKSLATLFHLGTQNQNNMKKKILLTALMGAGIFSLAQSQNARLQVIHNSADAAAATVDVYADAVLLFDDVDFRNASPFINVIPGTYLVGIAPGNSTDANDTIYAQSVTLQANDTYVAVANGIVSATGYSPATPFNIDIYSMGQETSNQAGNTDVLICHGSTDAPEVKVVDVTNPLNLDASNVLVGSASYGDFAGYLELPNADYNIQVRTMDNSTVQEYEAPLQTLGLNNGAAVVVASGFLDPSANSGGDAFGLYVALPAGGALVPLPTTATTTARLQVIHNCAATDAATVDVYANDAMLLDDFEFRTATPFVDIPAGVALEIDIAGASSVDATSPLHTQTITATAGEKYIVVASGTIGSGTYTPATAFNLELYAGAQEAAGNANETDVLVMHGATDAPTVDVRESSVPAGIIVDDISYPEFDGYLNLATADYVLDVETDDNAAVVASYNAPLQTLGLDGAAITVLASGFLDPTVNNNAASFGLWVALPSGGALVELPLNTSGIEEETMNKGFNVYPNPVQDVINIEIESEISGSANITLTATNGQVVMDESVEVVKGKNQIQLQNKDLGKGIYILHINSGNVAASQRIQVLK